MLINHGIHKNNEGELKRNTTRMFTNQNQLETVLKRNVDHMKKASLPDTLLLNSGYLRK